MTTLFKIILVFGIVLPAFASTVTLTKGDSWHLSFNIQKIDKEKRKIAPYKGDFSTLSIEGLKNSQIPGAPELPYYSFLVAKKAKDINVAIEFTNKTVLSNMMIAPVSDKPCRCQKGRELFQIDESKYWQDEDDIVEVKDLGDYRGKALSLVTIRPLISQGDKLQYFRDLEIELSSKDNLPLEEVNVKAQNQRMLIIGPRHLSGGIEALSDYKTQQGHDVISYVYEDVAKNSAELKNFIHGLYQKEAFQYAIILGFEDDVPTDEVETMSDPFTPSDFPYFAFGGADDAIPDVFYGRIVAKTNEDVINQIHKFREFENESWSDDSGRRDIVGIASNEGWDPTDVEYIQQMTNPLANNYSFIERHFFQDSTRSNPRAINQALNHGALWLNYIGHGIGDAWSSLNDEDYMSHHVASLNAGVVKPVIIDVACQNGRFNNENRLGETFMLAQRTRGPAGAVAFYGGSVDISWHPPAVMAVSINKYLASGVDSSLFELIMKGQLELLANFDDVDAAKENLLWYHLLGDPSLRIDSTSW